MAPASHGSRQVEETLRLARDAVEYQIANYRIVAFGVIAATTLVIGGLREGAWVPTACFVGALLYAVGLRAFLATAGNRPWLAVVSVVCDLAISASSFVVIKTFGGDQERALSAQFATYILAPGLVLVLLISSLRFSQLSAWVGAIAAPAMFCAVVVPIAGPHAAQFPAAILLLLAGLVGVATARQARKNLDSFARLHLLRRYLPPAAVERVMRDDPDDALSLDGRLATVTLLAADLRGFTAMSESLSPTEAMAQLNAYHGAMIEVIDRHGGAIDKFIGDGTLVVFGLSSAHSVEESARAAVRCASAMLHTLDEHNAARARSGLPALAMGIGIHTGPVVAGNLGVPGRRLEFTVIGDAVNTASRLEGQTKASGTPVIVSAATVDRLADASAVRELPPVSIRGKQGTLRVFALAAR